MLEFAVNGYRTFAINGNMKEVPTYIIKADHLADFDDSTDDKLCCVLNAIADAVADDGTFGFDVCQDMFDIFLEHAIIKTDIDAPAFCKEFDDMDRKERRLVTRFLMYPKFSFWAYRFTRRILAERAVHDELVARGVADDVAWGKANGIFERMSDLLQVEDVDEDMILSCLKLAVETFA